MLKLLHILSCFDSLVIEAVTDYYYFCSSNKYLYERDVHNISSQIPLFYVLKKIALSRSTYIFQAFIDIILVMSTKTKTINTKRNQ